MVTAAASLEADFEPHMLDGTHVADVKAEPYAHLVKKDVLPIDLYQSLNAEFPSLANILGGRIRYGNNEAVRMTASQVLTENRVSRRWQNFFAYHTSQDFWRSLTQLFGEHFRSEFPDLEERVGRPFEEWSVAPRGLPGKADVRLDCQFVMNTPVTEVSSVKSPHVDLCDKIFSGLFYFRPDEDQVSGGDLELYAWNRRPRFIKHRALQRDIELAKTITYAANTFACFVNSAKAVHGVSPRGITTIPRRYINFIAELPMEAFHPRQVGRWHKLWIPRQVKLAAHNDRY